jgi:hypothetical protein
MVMGCLHAAKAETIKRASAPWFDKESMAQN